jgi:hypothetical protein
MNNKLKAALVIIGAIIIGVGAVAYGAATAPRPVQQVQTVKSLTKAELATQLKTDQPTITGVLIANYPKVGTDYLINQGQLFNQGEWYGTTLTYKGTDSMNRDTLRVLMQKRQGVWILRTSPPQPLLSTVEFPDVPKSVLQTINKAISLPAGTETPAVATTN